MEVGWPGRQMMAQGSWEIRGHRTYDEDPLQHRGDRYGYERGWDGRKCQKCKRVDVDTTMTGYSWPLLVQMKRDLGSVSGFLSDCCCGRILPGRCKSD